ncbi:dihydrofolate reductase [Halobium salinum]|uniref:dihydrofolate reductase n=1 Tax=Halobium salinum TaxID=1364940 RepID=A0ABD5PFN2_9EURY|nr:dihydrofolate reductase [Halobium salinum]
MSRDDAGRDAPGVEFVLVAAVAENGVIGDDGGMPWHYPADLQHFKETTTGHPVVMGRRTYDSIVADIGGPLPERTSVVLTRNPESVTGPDGDVPDGVVVADGVEAAVEAAAGLVGGDPVGGTVYVVGGATVYEAFLPRADGMLLTRVPKSPDGDTRFPEWDTAEWTEVGREALAEGLEVVEYERSRND